MSVDRRHRRGQRGTATVEFAVAAPALLLLLLATAELSRAFIQYSSLSYAVREAARYATENSINGLTGLVNVSAATVTATRNIAVYGNAAGTGTARLPGFVPGQVTVQASGGTNITVTANYPYLPMLGDTLPGFGFGNDVPVSFTLRISTTMRAIS